MTRSALLGLLLLAVPVAGCTSSGRDVHLAAGTAQTSPGTAQTSPGPTAPAPPGTLASPVPAGTVHLVPGPFDDRFGLVGTRLAADGVHTRLVVTSDVSDVLALEMTADFYDRAGRLLGSGRVVRGDQHDASGSHVPDESLDLLVPAEPGYAARVASARLEVPVLVNE